MFGAVHHNTVRGDPFDAPALRVDEGDVVAVERVQILVVEAGPFAEVAVPRLERFRGGTVGHDRVDAGPDLFHLREVSQIRCAQTLFVGHPGDAGLPHDKELLDDAGPGVVDEVLVGFPAGCQQLEVLDTAALPAITQVGGPCRVCRAIAPNVDGRRGALKDQKVVNRFRQVRNTLDGGSAGSDDAHSLVRQLVQIAAGVFVIPPAGVKGVAAERRNSLDPR